MYAFTITLFCTTVFCVIRLIKEQRKAEQRFQKSRNILTDWNVSLPSESLAEADFSQMIRCLGAENERMVSAFRTERKETQDFYTAWVHQIKTPIAVMKLVLGSSESPDRRVLQEELFRIEQYTDMVLAY